MIELEKVDEASKVSFGKDTQISNNVSSSSLPMIQVSSLPSKNIPYPKGSQIYYRPYTYGEMDTFNDSKLGVAEKLRFIAEGMKTKGIDLNDITLNDFLYLGLLRKISSLGTTRFSIMIPVEGEAKPRTKVYDFEDIQFENLEVPTLPANITVRKTIMQFMPITLGRYLTLLDKDEDLINQERALMAAQCVNLEFNQSRELIENAIGNELTLLGKVDKLLDHGLLPLDVYYKDLNGKEQHARVELDDPYTLVWPFRGPEGVKDGSIWFGV